MIQISLPLTRAHRNRQLFSNPRSRRQGATQHPDYALYDEQVDRETGYVAPHV